MQTRTFAGAVLVIATAVSSCVADSRAAREVVASGTIDTADGFRTLTVAPPTAAQATVLEADRRWAEELPLVLISDARLLDDSTAIVVDERTAEVWLVPLPPRQPMRIAARGKGPGELEMPLAATPVQRGVLIWDPGRQNFNVYRRDGSVIVSARQPEDGDTDRFTRRSGHDNSQSNYQMRLDAVGEAIWFYIEDDEFDLAGFGLAGPPSGNPAVVTVARTGYLTRLADDFGSMDTVLAIMAPRRHLPPGGPTYGDGVFEWERTWAVGDSLVAIARTDSASVALHTPDGAPWGVVKWTPAHRPVTREDKRGHGRAIVRERSYAMPPEAFDPVKLNEAADRMTVVPTAPELTGLRLFGRCLWVSAFDVSDNSDGVSRTWWYYNLETAQGRAVTFGGSGVRLMHLTPAFALARRVDEDGAHSLYRYPIPDRVRSECGMKQIP